MKIADVRARAFAMPLNDPSYPRGLIVSMIANIS
jgi:acetoacetate decarboxylase